MRRIKEVKKTPVKVKIKRIFWISIAVVCVGFWYTPPGKTTIQFFKNACGTVAEKAHLVVDQVEAEGYKYTSKEDIVKALGVAQGMAVFEVDLKDAQKELLDLPWVKAATIERRLPSALYVRIREKELLALWQNDKRYLPVDSDGQVVQDKDISKLPPVMLVVGKDAPKHAVALKESLDKFPEIKEKVKSAVWIGNRRWDLYLDDPSDGLIVKLPDENIENALKTLLEKQNREKIFQKDLKSIDIRNPDQIVVRLRERKK